MSSSALAKFKLAGFILLAGFLGLYGTGLLYLENHNGRVSSWLMAMIGYYFIFGALLGIIYPSKWKYAGFLAWNGVLLGFIGMLSFGNFRFWAAHFAMAVLPFVSAMFGSYAGPRLLKENFAFLRRKK